MSRRKHALPLTVLLLCVLAANLAFVRQAFHMDDSIYLLLARNVAESPWSPQDKPAYFEGRYLPDLASTEHALPLTSYWMALAARLGGGFKEVPLHLGYLIFPLILACAMYALGSRFTDHPFLVATTFMFLPVVFVLSHTLMTDIPQLAFSAASVALLVAGIDSRRRALVWLSAFLVTCAGFMSYSSLCLIPLLAFYAIRRRDSGAFRIVLVVPFVLFSTWLAVSYIHYNRLPPGQILSFYFVARNVLSPGLVLRKSVYIIVAIGGVTIFPFSFLAFERKRPIAFALLLLYPAMWISGALQYPLTERILFALLFCSGVSGIVATVRAGLSRDQKDLFLACWFSGILLFAALAYLTGAARYLLLATPPLVLLFYRRLERRLGVRRLRLAAGISLILTASLAVMMARADYQFADMYREFASALRPSNSHNSGRLWFAGEWGFRAYLENAGGEELGEWDARPQPGDILAVPTLATPYATLFDDRLSLDSIVLVAPSELRYPFPAIPANSELKLRIGMPLADLSDGIDFSIAFDAHGVRRPLYSERIVPASGREWTSLDISLEDVAGEQGSIVFSAHSGSTADADGDWVTMAQARICGSGGRDEVGTYDFRKHLQEAQIKAVTGVEYQTRGNLPVFPMVVALRQEPASVLRSVHDYAPGSMLRLLDGRVHAGFWSMNWGALPFSFDAHNEVLESIRVYQVIRKVDASEESVPVWYSP